MNKDENDQENMWEVSPANPGRASKITLPNIVFAQVNEMRRNKENMRKISS
jgi:hypothetical protein